MAMTSSSTFDASVYSSGSPEREAAVTEQTVQMRNIIKAFRVSLNLFSSDGKSAKYVR